MAAPVVPDFQSLGAHEKKWLDAMVKTHVQTSRRYRTIQEVGERNTLGISNKGVMELTPLEFEYWRAQGGAIRRPTEELYPLACEIAELHVARGFRGSTVVNHTGQLIIHCHHCKAYLNNGLWMHAAKCRRIEQERKHPPRDKRAEGEQHGNDCRAEGATTR